MNLVLSHGTIAVGQFSQVLAHTCAVNSINTRLHCCLPLIDSTLPYILFFNHVELMFCFVFCFLHVNTQFYPLNIKPVRHQNIKVRFHSAWSPCGCVKKGILHVCVFVCALLMEQESAGHGQMTQTSMYCLASFIEKRPLYMCSAPGLPSLPLLFQKTFP